MLFRTTGIHCDENNYLNSAAHFSTGDAQGTGKPFLFYLVNYLYYHLIGRFLGYLSPISLHLVYAPAFAFSSLWAISPLIKKKFTDAWIYIALLVSPFILLNSGQVMMESALIPVLSIIFGLCIRKDSGKLKIILWSIVAILIKPTAIPALVLLAVCFFKYAPSVSFRLAKGCVAGIVLWKVTTWLLLTGTPMLYGDLSQLLSLESLRARALMTGQYAYGWLFFAGTLAIPGVIWRLLALRPLALRPLALRRNPDPLQETGSMFILLALGSLVLTSTIQFVFVYDFIRYTFPVIWIGTLAGIYLLAQAPYWTHIVLVGLFTIQSLPLLGSEFNRFKNWPHLVNYEYFESAGTILYGIPTHYFFTVAHMKSKRPCIEIKIPPGSDAYWAEQYFQLIYKHPDIVHESSCPTGSASLQFSLVRYQDDFPERNPPCRFQAGYCGYQRVSFFTGDFSPVKSQIGFVPGVGL